MKTTMRVTAALVFATALLAVGVGQASAKHAGESITVSKTTGLADGDNVRVTVAGFTPNAKPVKLVIAGQGDLVTIPDKLNFDEYAVAPEVPIAANGTGAADFVVTSDHGTVQDGTTLDCLVDQCWLIAVQEPFLPQPNYASQAISFGNEPPPPPPTTAAPTTAAPTTVAPTTAAPTTTEATTTTEEATTTTEVKVNTEDLAADDDEGSSSGLLLAIIAVVVVAIAVGGYFLTRKKADDGFDDEDAGEGGPGGGPGGGPDSGPDVDPGSGEPTVADTPTV